MKTIFIVLGMSFWVSIQAQTILQPGNIIDGRPIRRLTFEPTGIPSVGFGTELFSVNNHNIPGTSIHLTSIFDDGSGGNNDTLFVRSVMDSSAQPQPENHFYQYGLSFGPMVIAAGLSHQTVLPIRPIMLCASGIFNPELGWYTNLPYPAVWEFSPEGIQYDRFEPRYVAFASSRLGTSGENASYPRTTGIFNRIECGALSLDLYDIYPEEWYPTHKMFEIPLSTPFYINHVTEVDRKLLVSGFEVDASTAFIKQPKVLFIDLEAQTWQDVQLSFNGNNVEVISGLIIENEPAFFIVREVTALGELVQTKIVRYETSEILVTQFGDDFVPTSIIKQTPHGVLLGGNFDRFGLKTAALFEVEQYVGLKRMVGYADLGNVETTFKHYVQTVLGEMIAGSFDSLNGSPKGSFMTPLVRESLLSVEEPSTESLAVLFGDHLQVRTSEAVNVTVIDATGRIHRNEVASGGFKDLSGLPNGFYLISVWTERERQTLKTVFTHH